MLSKLVEVYRFYHNWMEPGVDRKTPAMRIRLARGRGCMSVISCRPDLGHNQVCR